GRRRGQEWTERRRDGDSGAAADAQGRTGRNAGKFVGKKDGRNVCTGAWRVAWRMALGRGDQSTRAVGRQSLRGRSPGAWHEPRRSREGDARQLRQQRRGVYRAARSEKRGARGTQSRRAY